MSINGVDPAAKTLSRDRRNWNRLLRGSVTSSLNVVQPIAIDAQARLILNVATNGGLTGSGNALSLKLDTNPGLQLGAGGVSVKLNVAGAITTGTSGLAVAVDSSTIEINTDALRVKDGGITTAKLANDSVDKDKLGILSAKGDILVFSSEPARLPVGSNGQVLSADSTATTGLKWIAATGGNSIKSWFTVTMVGGVATINDVNITTSCIILLTAQAAIVGSLYEDKSSRVIGDSTTIHSSSALDSPEVAYAIIDA